MTAPPATLQAKLRNALAAAGPACRDCFADLAERLAEVQNAVLTLIGHFGALGDDLAAQDLGADPVSEADSAARSLIGALPADSAESYGQARAAIRTALHEFTQEARSLKAYASLTRLTAASLHVDGLDAYVAEVHQIADAVRENTQGLSECVEVILRERGPAIAAQQAAAAGLRGMLADLAQTRAAGAGLARKDQPFRADLAQQVERLSQGGSAEIASLISIVQFADQFAQRLEHIEIILDSDADGSSVTVLATALQAALVEDAEAIGHAALGAIDRLGALARRSAAMKVADLSDSPLGQLLQARRSALEGVQRCNEATVASLDAAAAAAGQIAAAIADANQQFQTLRASAETIGVAATNALLLPGRTGDARLPLAVLANAVQQSAIAFRDKTAIASRSIDGLSDGFEAEVLTRLEQALRDFDTSVRLSSGRVDAADESQRRIEAILSRIGPALATLDAALQGSRAAMDAVLVALRGLRAVLAPARLPGPGAAGAPVDPVRVERFITLYTMVSEREVHARVTGVPLDEPAVEESDAVEFF